MSYDSHLDALAWCYPTSDVPDAAPEGDREDMDAAWGEPGWDAGEIQTQEQERRAS